MNLAGIYHRVDGVYGYQNEDGSFTARLRVPKDSVVKVEIIFGDRYNWKLVDKKNKVWKWSSQQKKVVPLKFSDKIYDYFETIMNDGSNEHRYRYLFLMTNKNEQKIIYGEHILEEIDYKIDDNQVNDLGFSWGYSNIGKYVSAPEWFKQTNWYQILPDRFAKSSYQNLKNVDLDKKYGGTIKGIINRLDYIKDLGFNGIYLNPIFEANTYHMYDTTNYLKIAASLGTLDDFKKLVQKVKNKGMRIILDGVFNHVGTDFFAWQDVLEKRANSRYKNWFFIKDYNNLKEPNNYGTDVFILPSKKPYSTFGNTQYMPRVNWSNKEVKAYFKQVVDYWMSLGIDGWRLDVADEPSFAFWRDFRKWVKSKNPKAVILGEVWYDSLIFLTGDQFDSTMNYSFRTSAIEYFIENRIDFTKFKNRFFRNVAKYSKPVHESQFNLITTHDTPRIATLANGDVNKLKAIFSWLYLNPGSTLFYYGDEYIETFKSLIPEDGRVPFDWDFNKKSSLFLHIKSILSFRNNHLKTIMSGIKTIEKDADNLVLTYENNGIIKLNIKNGQIII